MVVLLDSATALLALLQMLLLPAVAMLGIGIWQWYAGRLHQNENRLRVGSMLTMMGIIFVVILLITAQFLQALIDK